jgi:NAD(P)H-quinone oxidoreductase subunit 2
MTFVLKNEEQNLVFVAALSGLVLTGVAFLFLPINSNLEAFSGCFISNSFTILFRILLVFGAILTVLLSKKYAWNFGNSVGEFYTLILIATLGAMLLTGANDLIMLFVALETLSISSFALCGYTKLDRLSNEAALKYLIIGAVSSAVMLYGFSFLYGITGQTNMQSIAFSIPANTVNLALIMSFIFVIAGFGYKISAVPFHAWAPDVYQGAPIPVAAYLSVVSKIAGFAALIRFMTLIYSEIPIYTVVLGSIAVITMTTGNLMAIAQQNIKRLMAYSSIAQAGYVLLGLVVLTQEGISAIIFYLIIYLFMNFGVWAAIEIFAYQSGLDNIDDFNGLAHKNRYFALCMSICLLSLAGIPITAGFFAKFYLFKAVLFAGYQYMPLLLIALINTIIAVYYYVRIIKAMYVCPEGKYAKKFKEVKITYSFQNVLLITVLSTLLLGLFTAPLIKLSNFASSSLIITSKIR